MIEPDKSDKEAADTASAKTDVGDVETAGETTAVAAITGPTDTKPVGTDSMAKLTSLAKDEKDDE